MAHRKHVHSWEVPPVAQAIREHLTEQIPTHNDETYLGAYETSLFRVLYRFDTNQPGQPAYPKPETWGTLANYLGTPTKSTPGQPQPLAEFHLTPPKAGVYSPHIIGGQPHLESSNILKNPGEATKTEATK